MADIRKKTSKILYYGCISLFVAISPFCIHKTQAKEAASLKIEAVVGEKIISSFDVDSRIKFIIKTTGLPDNAEMKANIRPQVINTLINESLQLQEAEKNNIKIDKNEVEQAIRTIEVQRQIPEGGILSMLNKHKVPLDTFKKQIKAQIAWSKLLNKNIRPLIKINDEEVKFIQSYSFAEQEKNIKEIKISVINLPVENPKDELKIKNLAEKLFYELRRGADFHAIARQFSANNDISAFWIRPEQLEPNIAEELKSTAKKGAVTRPIRTENGFNIVKIIDIKSTKKGLPIDYEITLKEILFKLSPDSSDEEKRSLTRVAEQIMKNPGKCDSKELEYTGTSGDYRPIVSIQKLKMSQLSSALKAIVKNLEEGDISTPFASKQGVRMYMLCSKKQSSNSLIMLSKIKDNLFRQKFEIEAKKYLIDLRRKAFIEVRE
ncbi:MAG: peptidylprolyl isomerase [Rickettsiales bacterium]